MQIYAKRLMEKRGFELQAGNFFSQPLIGCCSDCSILNFLESPQPTMAGNGGVRSFYPNKESSIGIEGT